MVGKTKDRLIDSSQKSRTRNNFMCSNNIPQHKQGHKSLKDPLPYIIYNEPEATTLDSLWKLDSLLQQSEASIPPPPTMLCLEKVSITPAVLQALRRVLSSETSQIKYFRLGSSCLTADVTEASVEEFCRCLNLKHLRVHVASQAPATAAFPIFSPTSNIESLHVSLCSGRQDMIERLGNFLKNSETLQEFSMSGSSLSVDSLRLVAKAIKANKTVQSISFGDCGLSDAHIPVITEALSGRNGLVRLDLSGNNWRDDATTSNIADLVGSLPNLEELNLGLQRSPLAARYIAPALLKSNTLKNLFLKNCMVSDADVVAVANALADGSSVEYLDLSNNRSITDDSLVHLARRLPKMKRLGRLNICRSKDGKSRALAEAMRDGMKANQSVEVLQMVYCHRYVGMMRRVQFYANANHGGRQCLSQDLPEALWPLILERAWKTKYFCPLRQKPDLDNIYHLLRRGPILWGRHQRPPTGR